MPEQSQPSDDIHVPEIAGMSFRRFQGAADYPLLLALLTESEQADGIFEAVSLESIERWCAPSDRFDPTQDILLALADSADGEPSVIGFSRVSWYTGMEDTRLYYQTSFLPADWRERGFWPAMVRRNGRRLRAIAASHPVTPRRFFRRGRQIPR